MEDLLVREEKIRVYLKYNSFDGNEKVVRIQNFMKISSKLTGVQLKSILLHANLYSNRIIIIIFSCLGVVVIL